jgi:hypothetical protein
MEPYVILRGVADGLVGRDDVLQLESNNSKSTSLSLF